MFTFDYGLHKTKGISIYFGSDIFTEKKIILRGLLGGIGNTLMVIGFKNTNISEVHSLIYIQPIWSGVLAAIFINEPYTIYEFIGCIIGFTGYHIE